jgi:hypothetical protein
VPAVENTPQGRLLSGNAAPGAFALSTQEATSVIGRLSGKPSRCRSRREAEIFLPSRPPFDAILLRRRPVPRG